MDELARQARNAYFREYRAKNAEARREYQRKWRKENPEKVRAASQRYWAKKAAQMEANHDQQ